jgi:two-component system, cell cycle response regulator
MTFTERLTVPSADSYRNPGPNDTVLITEDDIISRVILQTWLNAWGYSVVVAENGVKAWDILQEENAPQFVILRFPLQGVDGAELCRRVRQRQQNVYILFVTANNEKQEVQRGFAAGADDHLVKPFDAAELRARLRFGQRILALHDQLRLQSTVDARTGILNRGSALDMLHSELVRVGRAHAPTGILIVDLDHFKKINDTCGHGAGDGVLKEVAKRVSRTVRTWGFVGRYGGGEFLIVLPRSNTRDVRETAERIRVAVAGKPILAAGSEIWTTTSVGGTVVTGGAISVKEILASADAALYRAKAAGRNCVFVHDFMDKSTKQQPM